MNIEKKIILRDLKTDNLMVKEKKTPQEKNKLKFIDLETIKDSNINLSQSITYCSTPMFSPPEFLM